ncbi:uncharacterized protein METZ01_LOCUS350834 [marine metagenome]|uniref:Uncharacterized protein n=1 Tax=marine metagenome TaxID=408172 RepID=A0A382RKN5_9ZZZZ
MYLVIYHFVEQVQPSPLYLSASSSGPKSSAHSRFTKLVKQFVKLGLNLTSKKKVLQPWEG